jgi:hypothetical protein
MSVATLDNLSVLQRELLKKALRSYYDEPFHIAIQCEDPGCFDIRTVGRTSPDPNDFSLRWKKASKEERRKNASLRSAAGLSVARLIKRGLVESCSRGKWRLTGAGLKVAQKLWPELKPMSKKEVASAIAFRELVHSVAPPRRKRPRAKTLTPQVPKGSLTRNQGWRSGWIIRGARGQKTICANFVPI